MKRTSKNKAKGLVKWTEDEYHEKLVLIAQLYRRGWSTYEIATHPEIGCTQPYVSILLKKIRDQYSVQVLMEQKAMIVEKLEEYRDIRRVAWRAYEEALANPTKIKHVVDKMPIQESDDDYDDDENRGRRRKKKPVKKQGEMVIIKDSTTTENRFPPEHYLKIVLDTLQAERELLGLDAPKRVDARLEGKVETFDWTQFVNTAMNGENTTTKSMNLLYEEERKARENLTRIVIEGDKMRESADHG